MAQVELIMPKMGESIMEATILKWLKAEGDFIEVEESVLEIATDKVDSEVPAPEEGTLVKKLYQEGDVVAVGKAIALIEVKSELNVTSTPPKTNAPELVVAAANGTPIQQASSNSSTVSNGQANNRFYSPLVLNIARRENIDMDTLALITGTGKKGRVTKKDILAFVANKKDVAIAQPSIRPPKTEPKPAPKVKPSPQTTPQPVSQPARKPVNQPTITYDTNNVEIVEMDRMRRLIADHMVMSKHTSPHVTSFVEVDVTDMVNWRNKIKQDFQKREGEKITFTPLFVEAVTKAIKDFPMVNASVDGHHMIIRKNINVGMATALPSGNLIVPVIHHADRMNLVGLTKSINDLASRARNNQLKPSEVQGGTFTLTNIGSFGSVMGTPIINQPQVAILAVGAIRKKPAVLETEYGDVIAIRQMMFMSLSYDHRIVDGALGSRFLKQVADYLEDFDVNRNI